VSLSFHWGRLKVGDVGRATAARPYAIASAALLHAVADGTITEAEATEAQEWMKR
jgi:hypothetical protein